MPVTIEKICTFCFVFHVINPSLFAVEVEDMRCDQVVIFVKKTSCSTKYELKANGFGQIVFKAWFHKKHKTYEVTNLGTLAILTALTELSQEESEFELTACRCRGASRDKKPYPIYIPRYKLCLPPSSLIVEKKNQQIVVVNDLRVWCCIREAISGYSLLIQEFDRQELEGVRVELVQSLSDDFGVSVENVEAFVQSSLFKEKVDPFFFDFDHFDSFLALQELLGQYERLGPSLAVDLTNISRVAGDDLIPMTILVFLSRLHSRSFYMSYLFVLMSENALLYECLSGKQQYQLVTLSSAFQHVLSVIKEKTGHDFIEKAKKYQLFFE